MKTIRKNTFETNSSSTHSITVARKNVAIPVTEQNIFVEIGEFGWEFKTYDTPQEVLSYLYTAICCNYKQDYKKYTDKIDKVLAENTKTKVEWQEPKFDEYGYLNDGYIDHGYELAEWLETLFENEELLLRTIFFGVVETGNDNDGCEDEMYCGQGWFNNAVEDVFYKGN